MLKNLPVIVKVFLPGLIAIFSMFFLYKNDQALLEKAMVNSKKMVDINIQSTILSAEMTQIFGEINTDVYAVLTKKAANKDYKHSDDIKIIKCKIDMLIKLIEKGIVATQKNDNGDLVFIQKNIVGNKSEKIPGYNDIMDLLDVMLGIDFSGAVNAVEPFSKKYEEISALFKNMNAASFKDAQNNTDVMAREIEKSKVDSLIILSIVILLTLSIILLFGAEIILTIRRFASITDEFAKGNTNTDLNKYKRRDEFGKIVKALVGLKTAVSNSQRLQRMIDNLSVPVLLCDDHGVIHYCNKASIASFTKLRFDSDDIIGKDYRILYKGNSNILNLSYLPFNTEYALQGEWIQFNAYPLFDQDDGFEGIYIDWKIVTEEVAQEKSAQSNIQELLDASKEGDFSKRIPLNADDSFYSKISANMNDLMDIIEHPINDVVRVLDDLSKGQLTVKMQEGYRGAFKNIEESINKTILILKKLLTKIMLSSDLINQKTHDFSSNSENLSRRTEQQAADVLFTAETMDAITASIANINMLVDDASKTSQHANELGMLGTQELEETQSAISKIERSTKRILKITQILDELSFQTNLLALNASIEAARIGHLGDGFNVVANEVRELSKKSAQASQNIQELLRENYEHVNKGANLLHKTTSTLLDMIASVQKIDEVVQDVNTFSKEQTDKISQINQVVHSIDQSTQLNARLADENKETSSNLAKQTEQLQGMVRFFKVE
ncbi:MAG: hypothetical protein NEHIOOID_00393 [Holosporales bacterium]